MYVTVKDPTLSDVRKYVIDVEDKQSKPLTDLARITNIEVVNGSSSTNLALNGSFSVKVEMRCAVQIRNYQSI